MPDLCPKGIDFGVKPSAPSCPLTLPLFLGLQTDSHCPHGGPNNSCLSTTSDYSGFSRNSDHRREEMEDRRQREEEKQVSPIYPWDHMRRTARETEEQPQKLLPLYETPTGKNNQSVRVNNQRRSGRLFR